MSMKKRILQTAGAGALLAMFAMGAQANLLSDPSFESPDASGGDVGGCAGNAWDCFNSNFIASNLINNNPPGTFYNPLARTGDQVLKQFGGDAGYLQGVAVNAGDTVDASAYAISYTGDPFNNLALLQLAFFDASNNVVGPLYETFCDSVGNQACTLLPSDGDPASEWTQMAVQGVAPVGTVKAQILLLHILTDGTPAGGSLFWDDASITATPSAIPVPAAVWLFGSGLIGLVGVARRRKAQA